MELKFYHCRHCGNIAVKPFDSGVPLVCCGEQMEELVANTTDAALEKHVPDVKVDGSNVHVQVGSTLHPMTPEHYIEWVFVQTTAGGTYCHLTPDDEPEVMFPLQPDEVVSVYEYCNIHGLWKAAEPPLPNFFDTNDVACSPEFSAGCINPLTDKD